MKRAMMCMAVAGVLAFGVGLALAADAPAGAGDQKAAAPAPIKLPDAAAAAITKAFPKASMGKVSTFGRGDTPNYLVAMTEGDQKYQVRVTDAGLIVSISVPIKVEDLPKVVADAVKANSEDAKVDTASKVEWRADRRGSAALEKPEFSYAVRLVKGDQFAMLNVAEDGTVRRPPQFRPIPPPEAAPAPAATK